MSKRRNLATAESQSKKISEELKKIKNEITPKMMDNLFELLSKKSPHRLVQLVEAVVGLLRN